MFHRKAKAVQIETPPIPYRVCCECKHLVEVKAASEVVVYTKRERYYTSAEAFGKEVLYYCPEHCKPYDIQIHSFRIHNCMSNSFSVFTQNLRKVCAEPVPIYDVVWETPPCPKHCVP